MVSEDMGGLPTAPVRGTFLNSTSCFHAITNSSLYPLYAGSRVTLVKNTLPIRREIFRFASEERELVDLAETGSVSCARVGALA